MSKPSRTKSCGNSETPLWEDSYNDAYHTRQRMMHNYDAPMKGQ